MRFGFRQITARTESADQESPDRTETAPEGVLMGIEKSEFIWHNGKLIRWDDATLHVMSHVVHYGSSVFEGIRCYAPPAGPAIFRATEHIQRLLDSAKVYRMDVGFGLEELVAAMGELVRT